MRATAAVFCGGLIALLSLHPSAAVEESPAKSKSFGKAVVAFEQDVLAIDPAGKGRGISSPSVALPGGFRYEVRVHFTPEKIDRDHREDFLRTVTLYEYRARPGADCTGAACWFVAATFSSERSRQEQSFDVPKDTRWMIAIWRITPKDPEGEDQPPTVSCQELRCWKIENVKEGADRGVSFEMAQPDESTTVTVVQRPR